MNNPSNIDYDLAMSGNAPLPSASLAYSSPSANSNTVGGDFSYSPAVQGGGLAQSAPQGFGGNMSGLGGLGKASLALQGVTGLMGLYNAYQQNQLMKKQFKASLADRNQNVANQAKTTNLGLANQADMAAQLYGNNPGSAGHSQYVKDNLVQVDGSPVRA